MNVSTVEEVPQYPDPGIRSDAYSRLTRSLEGCEACAKCVSADRPPEEHQQKIYMAIQIVRRQSRGSAQAISSFSPMHCWQSRLASYLPANGPRALKWLPAGCIWKLCCSACRPIACRARGCISEAVKPHCAFRLAGLFAHGVPYAPARRRHRPCGPRSTGIRADCAAHAARS